MLSLNYPTQNTDMTTLDYPTPPSVTPMPSSASISFRAQTRPSESHPSSTSRKTMSVPSLPQIGPSSGASSQPEYGAFSSEPERARISRVPAGQGSYDSELSIPSVPFGMTLQGLQSHPVYPGVQDSFEQQPRSSGRPLVTPLSIGGAFLSKKSPIGISSARVPISSVSQYETASPASAVTLISQYSLSPSSQASGSCPTTTSSSSAEGDTKRRRLSDVLIPSVPFPVPNGDFGPGTLDSSYGQYLQQPGIPPIGRQRIDQACEKCRERKARCNGGRPSCQRCVNRGLQCVYAVERRMRGPNKVKKPTSKGYRSTMDSQTPASDTSSEPTAPDDFSTSIALRKYASTGQLKRPIEMVDNGPDFVPSVCRPILTRGSSSMFPSPSSTSTVTPYIISPAITMPHVPSLGTAYTSTMSSHSTMTALAMSELAKAGASHRRSQSGPNPSLTVTPAVDTNVIDMTNANASFLLQPGLAIPSLPDLSMEYQASYQGSPVREDAQFDLQAEMDAFYAQTEQGSHSLAGTAPSSCPSEPMPYPPEPLSYPSEAMAVPDPTTAYDDSLSIPLEESSGSLDNQSASPLTYEGPSGDVVCPLPAVTFTPDVLAYWEAQAEKDAQAYPSSPESFGYSAFPEDVTLSHGPSQFTSQTYATVPTLQYPPEYHQDSAMPYWDGAFIPRSSNHPAFDVQYSSGTSSSEEGGPEL